MADDTRSAEHAPSRTPTPTTVALITMGRRPATAALFDGLFWRSADAHGPIKCAPSAVTSIETPLLYSPASMPEEGQR